MPPTDTTPAIRAVLLDAGNTLFTLHRSRAEIYGRAASTLGLDLDTGEIARRIEVCEAGMSIREGGHFRYRNGWFLELLRRIFDPDGGRPGTVEALGTRLFAEFADPSTYRPFPDVLPALRELRDRGLRSAVVSNWSPSLPEVLRGLGFASLLDEIVVSAVEEVEKPDPEIFRRALVRLRVGAVEAIHVGDGRVNDVEGARGAGITGVLIDRRGDGRAGSAVVRGLAEVPALVDRLGREAASD